MSVEIVNKVGRLPDYYDKKKGSNNWKILELNAEGNTELLAEIDDLRDLEFLDTAHDYLLDIWGMRYNIPRNGLKDDPYRALLKLEQSKDMANIDYTSWYSLLLQIIGCDPEDLNLIIDPDKQEILLDVDIDYYYYAEALHREIQSIAPLCALLTIDYMQNTWEQARQRTWGELSRVTWMQVFADKRFRHGGAL